MKNRVDCCGDRLSDSEVLLKNGASTVAFCNIGTTEIMSIFNVAASEFMTFDHQQEWMITASKVRVQLDFTNHLSLTQVEVYDNSNTNRAQAQYGGTATQSSTRSYSESASNAIDGDTNTHTHTNSHQQGENQTDDLQLLTRNTIVPHSIAIIFLFALNP